LKVQHNTKINFESRILILKAIFRWFIPTMMWESQGNEKCQNYRAFKSFYTSFHVKKICIIHKARGSQENPNPTQQTTQGPEGKITTKNHMANTAIICQNFKAKITLKFHEILYKKWTKGKTKVHITLERILARNHIPNGRFQMPKSPQKNS
jgi:hypothetical protein